MGRNRWRESPVWPIDGTRTRAMYLRGGGRLAWDAPAGAEPPDRYLFDPNDPVEDPHVDDGLGPRDQRKIESRPDVLVYTSEPLDRDLEVIGPVEMVLYAAS